MYINEIESCVTYEYRIVNKHCVYFVIQLLKT